MNIYDFYKLTEAKANCLYANYHNIDYVNYEMYSDIARNIYANLYLETDEDTNEPTKPSMQILTDTIRLIAHYMDDSKTAKEASKLLKILVK